MKPKLLSRLLALVVSALAVVMLFAIPLSAYADEEPTCTYKTGHSYHWVDSAPATCTEAGLREWKCFWCGYVKTTEPVAKLGHTWKTTTTEAATCTEKGKAEKTCTRCGATESEEIAAAGHKWAYPTTTKEATCTTAGEKTSKCSVCGATRTEAVEALGHSWKVISTKEPTCEMAGYVAYRKCQRCGEIEGYQETPAKGHVWSDWQVIEQASCGVSGLRERACSVCGETETEQIASLEHSWGSYKVTKKATCGKDGVSTRICSVCGKSEKKTIKAAGKHKWKKVKGKASTCKKAGYSSYKKCSKCGTVKGKKTLKKKKHTYKYSPASRNYCLLQAQHYQNLYEWAKSYPNVAMQALALKYDKLIYKWKKASLHPYKCTKCGHIK